MKILENENLNEIWKFSRFLSEIKNIQILSENGHPMAVRRCQFKLMPGGYTMQQKYHPHKVRR